MTDPSSPTVGGQARRFSPGRLWPLFVVALAFAVVGQARARGLLTPESEDRLLGRLISYWALSSTLEANARLAAAMPAGSRGRALPDSADRLPARPPGRQLAMRSRIRASRVPEYRP